MRSITNENRQGRLLMAGAVKRITVDLSGYPDLVVVYLGMRVNMVSAEQIKTIGAWADAGAPAGNASDAPAPPTWSKGWNIPQPDVVVKMLRPVEIPAHGEVEYTYEIVPTHFSEDKWVQMVEVRPSSPAHVHHAVVYIRPPDSSWLRHAPVGEAFIPP